VSSKRDTEFDVQLVTYTAAPLRSSTPDARPRPEHVARSRIARKNLTRILSLLVIEVIIDDLLESILPGTYEGDPPAGYPRHGQNSTVVKTTRRALQSRYILTLFRTFLSE
jgi:hypothetical protein